MTLIIGPDNTGELLRLQSQNMALTLENNQLKLAISAARSEARREALEEAESRIVITLEVVAQPSSFTTYRNGQVSGVQGCLNTVRALMEKDASVPTSDALDPAGLEAAAKQLIFASDQMRAARDLGWEYTLIDAAKDVVAAYHKAAKGENP